MQTLVADAMALCQLLDVVFQLFPVQRATVARQLIRLGFGRTVKHAHHSIDGVSLVGQRLELEMWAVMSALKNERYGIN